jgi:hypothetical protein
MRELTRHIIGSNDYWLLQGPFCKTVTLSSSSGMGAQEQQEGVAAALVALLAGARGVKGSIEMWNRERRKRGTRWRAHHRQGRGKTAAVRPAAVGELASSASRGGGTAAPTRQGGGALGQRPRHSARGAQASFYRRGARPWEGRQWPGLLVMSTMDTGHGWGLGPDGLRRAASGPKGEMGRAFGLGPDS